MAVHIYKPSTQEAKAGDLKFQVRHSYKSRPGVKNSKCGTVACVYNPSTQRPSYFTVSFPLSLLHSIIKNLCSLETTNLGVRHTNETRTEPLSPGTCTL